MLATTTALHYEALGVLARTASARTLSHWRVISLLSTLVGLHLCEVALYALAYAGGASFGLGRPLQP
jgi:hypothetical protein